MNSTPTCIGACLFLLLGLGMENQNQTKLQEINSTPMCTGAGLFLLPRLGRETNPKSDAGK